MPRVDGALKGKYDWFLYIVLFVMSISSVFLFQYADPVTDLLDKWGVFRARLFRESCVFHRGNYVKVSIALVYVDYRATTCLKNLEMSGNLTAVMEVSGNWPKVGELSGKTVYC